MVVQGSYNLGARSQDSKQTLENIRLAAVASSIHPALSQPHSPKRGGQKKNERNEQKRKPKSQISLPYLLSLRHPPSSANRASFLFIGVILIRIMSS